MPSNFMQSSRDPHPFPKLQNDNDFYGQRYTEKRPYEKPTHLAQNEDPWNRLNSTCTLTSSRHEVYHQDPQAPNDSLDFILKSKYDHHDEFLKAKNETLYQPETKGDEHGRVLKNRIVEVPKQKPYLGHPLTVEEQKKKDSIHTIENAIDETMVPNLHAWFQTSLITARLKMKVMDYDCQLISKILRKLEWNGINQRVLTDPEQMVDIHGNMMEDSTALNKPHTPIKY